MKIPGASTAKRESQKPAVRLLAKSKIYALLLRSKTRLPKVIWEEVCVAAQSHTYAAKSSLVTMARPKFAPKCTFSRGPSPKPHYLPHPWTRPTYDAKRHPDLIRRFSTQHWTDRRTYGRTNRQTDRSSTGKFDRYWPLRYESDAA